MATVYDPIAKDGSLNTTEVTPRNIADVLAEELSGIASALTPAQLNSLADVTISSPSDGQTLKYDAATQKWVNANDAGGHTIENPSGTDMTQRGNLQFTGDGVSVTDDAVDGKTIVDISPDAEDIPYDNTDTDLSSTNVQDAIEEIATPTFTEASTRANIDSGESFSTILGKIKKFFTDLKTVAFTGAYSDLSGTEDVADKVLKITVPSFSTLPVTVSNASITADMEVTHFVLGSNVWIDATCTTASGSLTISGSVGGSTTLTLYLEVPRA